MNRKDFVRRVTSVLHDGGVRKSVIFPRHVFHISDDDGHSKDFTIKKANKYVHFTVDDVDAILDACFSVIEESMRNGDEIILRGFGTFGVRYMNPRAVRNITDGEKVHVGGRYLPRFEYGRDLVAAAKVYQASLEDKEVLDQINDPTNEDGE